MIHAHTKVIVDKINEFWYESNLELIEIRMVANNIITHTYALDNTCERRVNRVRYHNKFGILGETKTKTKKDISIWLLLQTDTGIANN